MPKTINQYKNLNKLPKIDFLKTQLSYDSEKGKLYWKVRSACRISIGDEAGTFDQKNNTIRVQICNEQGKRTNVMAQILAWAIHYESYPDRKIKFKNDNRLDLRITNLYLS
jgi:hypothetical protein